MKLQLLWHSSHLFWVALYASVATVTVQAETVAQQSLAWVGVMTALFGVALVAVRIPIGIAFGKVNQKGLLLGGLFLVGAGNAVVPLLAAHPVSLLASRFLLGAGAGFWVVYSLLYINHFSQDIQRAAARITLTYGSGITIGGIGGGFVAQQWGWHAPFWFGTVAALLAIGTVWPMKHTQRMPYAFSKRRLLELFLDARLLVISSLGFILFFVGTATVWSFTQNFAYAHLDADRLELGLVALAMLVPYALAIRFAYAVRDRLGTEGSLAAGLAIGGLATFAIPFATTIHYLYLLQGAVGVGLGVMFSTLMALSVEGIPLEHRGETMGVFQTIYALGFLLGPLAAGGIAGIFGLPAIFYAMGGLAVLVALGFLGALASPLRTRRAFRLALT